MAHYFVGWGGHIRYAKATDEHEAKIKAFGVVAMDMKTVQLPKSPKYLSAKLKEKYNSRVST